MPEFEFEFNQQDNDLIVSQEASTLEGLNYIRLTIYPTEAIDTIVDLPDDTKGIDGKAIFFSSALEGPFDINISPFRDLTGKLNDINGKKSIGTNGVNDFKIYQNDDDDIYIKPNEIFNDYELPQGNYKIQIDFLYQEESNEPFVIKQVSTSRKEVRIKIIDEKLTDSSDIISKLTSIFNDNQPEFLDETDLQGNPLSNPEYKYQFKHILNIGTGDHIPIMNYQFDRVTDGRDNQSLILKLYDALPTNVGNLSMVTIEREVLTTQTQDIFYFSDVPDVFFGDGLESDAQENWINPDGNDIGFENFDELSGSIDSNILDNLISESLHNYPNLNTDFNEFENHTFFGSAKKKLENFKTKVETIQGYYTEISSSLVVSSSFNGDSDFVIQKRKNLFEKIDKEFKTFTPYERFLYYDGQNETTASAPGLGKNYADSSFPVSGPKEGRGNQVKALGKHNGFNTEVYKFSSHRRGGNHNQFSDVFTDKYQVHNKPFFNYSGSIYLSFLLQGDSGSAFTFQNAQKDVFGTPYGGFPAPLPQSSKFRRTITSPDITGSKHQRFIFETSHSYFVPNTANNDMMEVTDFTAGSTQVTMLGGSLKTGSAAIKDSTNIYPTTVITQSGVPFKGSVMPAGELFRVFYRNQLSESLQARYSFDEGTGTTAFDTSGNGNNGTIKNGATYTSDAAFALGEASGSFALEFDGTNDYVELAADAFGDLSTTDFSITAWINPGDDIAEFDAIVAKRADGGGSGFVFDLRDKTGEDDGAHPFGIGFAIEGSALQTVDSSATIPKNQYSHVAAVVDRDANVKLYVNGRETGSAAIDLTDQGSEINVGNKIGIGARIANDGATLSNKFPGKIDEVRFYRRTLTPSEINQLYLNPDGITETKITDVKVTFNNPTNVLPFDNVYKTTSTEWNNWYTDLLTKAETFDTDNIHSFENNLPLYIQDSSDYNDMKDFLNLQGEQYDLIRNHIDSLGTLHKRGYKKTNSPPTNILPMLLSNMGWQAINPFDGDLSETLGQFLDGVTTIDDIKNQTWRKTLNNLLYIYKSKGTKNSVRGLLNTYGYPPDMLEFQEFGGSTEESNPRVFVNTPPSTTGIDLSLNNSTGSFSFTSKKEKLYRYSFGGSGSLSQDRKLTLDWWMDDANINTLQFIYKHANTTNPQTILESSGSNTQSFWDLRLVPSLDGVSSSFQFRLNNSLTGSGAIALNAVSMSTNYSKILDGQLWNVMLQRMTSSTSTNITNEYRLHSSLQDGKTIKTYNYVTMSVSGGISIDSNNLANQNWFSTGSRHPLSSSNLFVGETFSGSLAQLRGWATALSTSKFRQHTLNKFSTVGNTISSHKDELIYSFKLNENYSSASVSSSNQNLKIVDSAPTTTYSDYSFTKPGSTFNTSSVYGFDLIEVVKLTLQDNISKVNNNNVLINPRRNVVSNLSPIQSAIKPLTQENSKPLFKTSKKLELYRSPQTFVDNFILDNLSGFNLETLYGNPTNYYSQSYGEFDTFRENFFDAHPIEVDVNTFIRAHESMFNQSIIEGLKSVVPARSTFSGEKSNFGVEIKPTILEKQKYENEEHSIEVNPNKVTGSINPVVSSPTSEHILSKSGSISVNVTNTTTYELPYSQSISLGNAYVTSSGYLKDAPAKNHFQVPFLQPDGYVVTIENPYSASSISTLPSLSDSAIVQPKSGSIDYATIANESFVNIHDNWGTGTDKTHFINYGGGKSSVTTDYNTYHIDTRNHFYSIGDSEYYSASKGKASTFDEHTRFYNRLLIDDDFHSEVTYESLINGTTGGQSGRMMGKTRYFLTSSNGNITLPRNHVTKFSQPFKEQMIDGAQNINPGILNVQYEDYSTASFYRVKVTGGENEIKVQSGPSNLDSNNKIIYG